MPQLRDVGLVNIDFAVGVVVVPEDVNESECEEKRKEGEDGLEDGPSYAFVVRGSHVHMLLQVDTEGRGLAGAKWSVFYEVEACGILHPGTGRTGMIPGSIVTWDFCGRGGAGRQWPVRAGG